MPTTAFSTYIIEPDSKNKNKTKTGKKQAHKMQGVLLTMLYFMVLSGNSDNLASMMGEKKLSEYIKLFDLTLGLEAFLTKSKLIQEDVDLAGKCILKYIKDFVDCINHQEGQGIK